MPELFSVDWPSVRAQAVQSFGEVPPHPEVEDEIIAVFEKNPQLVMKMISEVAAKVATGKIRSGWRILRKEVTEIEAARSTVEVRLDDPRDKLVAQARRWLATAGASIPSIEEFNAQLFGDPKPTASLQELEELERSTRDAPGRPMYERLLLAHLADARAGTYPTEYPPSAPGLLEAYGDDTALRGEMAELWLKARSSGVEIEEQAEVDARAWLAAREAIDGAPVKPAPRPDTDMQLAAIAAAETKEQARELIRAYVAEERERISDEEWFETYGGRPGATVATAAPEAEEAEVQA